MSRHFALDATSWTTRRFAIVRSARSAAFGLVVASLACVLLANAVEGQIFEEAFAEGFPEIYMPQEIESARAAGMGRVTSIARDGAIAAWWSPAFLAYYREPALLLSHADLWFFAEELEGSTRSATLSGRIPFGLEEFVGGLGFKRHRFRVDTFTPFGGPNTIEWTEDAYVVSLARAFGSLSLGTSFEYVRVSASDGLIDDPFSLGFGAAFQHPIRLGHRTGFESNGMLSPADDGDLVLTPLAGASFLHVGQDYQEDFELARQLRGGIGLGLAFEPPPDARPFDSRRWREFELVTALEVYFPAVELTQISQERAVVHMGSELTLFGMISARIGFIDDDRRRNLGIRYRLRDETFGFGICLPQGLPVSARVDWASVPSVREERIDRWSVEIGLPRDGQSPPP